MEERIIDRYLNLEKISRKEVNFKSKLIEWSQKNKFEIEFNLLDQSVDADQNPTFETQITVENIPAGSGKGYSKKESQQEAARETLSKIKSDPQFIDAIFAAKAEREQAQEAKTLFINVPDSLCPLLTKVNREADGMPQQEETVREELLESKKTAEKYDDVERIISEAEEAAFLEESGKASKENKKEKV